MERNLEHIRSFCPQRERYANIDKFTYLTSSKLSGDSLEAIAGYQLLNENYQIVVDVLKKSGNKQVVIDVYYHNLSHLLVASNQASSFLNVMLLKGI